MQQPPQLVPHLVPTARPIPTLHPMAIFHLILSNLLILYNYRMPLQVAAVRQPFVRINMRTNQFHFHSTPFHRRPIPIQFTLGDPQVQADRLLPTLPNTSCDVDHICFERRLCGSAKPFQSRPFSGGTSTLGWMHNARAKVKA